MLAIGGQLPAGQSTKVGSMSIMPVISSVAVPAGILPGHQAIVGSRMPPSHVLPLKPRSGALTARGVPPLSEVNSTSVRSASFSSRTACEDLADAPIHLFDPVAVDAVGRFALNCLAGIDREMDRRVRQIEKERFAP